MSEQKILSASENYAELDQYFDDQLIKSVFLVCDASIKLLKIGTYFDNLEERTGIKVKKFSNFEPNPLYESVEEGVKSFRESKCDMIVAVGGGSAIDVAKCIKLYSGMEPGENYLKKSIIPNNVKLLAMPTTAGTGSEATKFAVVYYNGEKQSIAHESCIPSVVLMDAGALLTLPVYQKKSTMMDALCHSVESFWSVNSTDESKTYSAQAIKMIIENKDAYLSNDEEGCINMLKAANLAGKAINITQTTAGHAMCYKLTSLYGIAHGHAAALCLSALFPYMIKNTCKCVDPRGAEYLNSVFAEIAQAFGCGDSEEAVSAFDEMLSSLELSVPVSAEGDIEILKNSVNPVRLKNNPVALDKESIGILYRSILNL